MAKISRTALGLVLTSALTLGMTAGAHAAVIGFVTNPTGNAADWASHVAGTGAGISTIVNFESHPLAALDGGFYAGQGVTMAITAPIFQGVVDVTGIPSGSSDCPCSTGEGAFPLSRALVYSDVVSLTISFASAVSAFGVLTGDHYDPRGTDPITIEAFTGTAGTGTSLGSFQSAPLNFQLGFSYFMGVASNTNEIMSIVITDGFSGTSDGVDLDNFQVGAVGVPEPASLVLLAGGLAGLLGLRRRR